MHVCNPARVWTLQRLAIWFAFWLHTTFCNSLWNLCSASAIQLLFEPRQLLCHPAHSHLLYVKPISTKHITLVSHVSFPACFTSDMFQSSQVNFSHGTNRQTFPMTSSAMLKFNSNTFKRKLQISSPRFPLLLFTLSHTPTHKLHYRSIPLSGYSAKFYCCKSC